MMEYIEDIQPAVIESGLKLMTVHDHERALGIEPTPITELSKHSDL